VGEVSAVSAAVKTYVPDRDGEPVDADDAEQSGRARIICLPILLSPSATLAGPRNPPIGRSPSAGCQQTIASNERVPAVPDNEAAVPESQG
jgi:hypothetical protein